MVELGQDPALIPISKAISEFLTFMKFRKGATETTLITYSSILHDFLSVSTDITCHEVTNIVIDEYANALSLRGYKPKTYRNKLVVVKSFVTYLYNYDRCEMKPGSIVLPKERQQEANFLNAKESKQFLNKVKDIRDRAMMLVLISSGLRVSELTELRLGDLYKRSIAVRNGKGRKQRVTFITPEARKAVDDYLTIRGTHPGFLFPNPSGDSLSRVIVARKVSFYASKANLDKKVTTHTLRHTFATGMLKKGARVEDVQQILGHSNIRTTLIYLHFTNYDLEKSYNKVMLKT